MSYAVLQQKIMSLPEEYINIVSAYIDSLPPVKDKEKKVPGESLQSMQIQL